MTKLLDSDMSRGNFLKLSATVGGGLMLSGCSSLKDNKDGAIIQNIVEKNTTIEDDGIKVVPTVGQNNCGGRCVIKAYVKDGNIIKLGTDTEEDKPNSPQLRACVRGRGYRKTFLHPDRLKYPMKRVGKRGEGKFERISWDEAVDIIASETARIRDEYGPLSRYVNHAWGVNAAIHPMYLAERLLALDGGYLGHTLNYSWGQGMVITPKIYGTNSTANSMDDLVNTDLIILWGHNPATTVIGTTNAHLRRAKDKGIKIVVIDPRYTGTVSAFADEWIPIRPGSDSAMAVAMAQVMIEEDLIDKDFIDKFTQGFDSDTMPEDLKDEETFRDYVMGESDGIVKTPEWAEKITGVPADTIRELAREYAKADSAALIQGFGPQRTANGEEQMRTITMLPIITGNVGKSGGWASGLGLYSRINVPWVPIPEGEQSATIPCFKWTEAIERGKDFTPEDDGLEGVDKLDHNIKAIYNLAGNILINQHSDINKTKQLLEDESKVEFIVVSDQFMTPSAMYADVLLPGDTMFERHNIGLPSYQGDFVIYGNKAIERPFEVKNEYYWLADVADKLGIGDEFRDGNETMEDWTKWIVEETRKNHEDFPTFEELQDRGVYKFEFDEPYIAFKDQIEDIENNPFETPSGKIEIFSRELFDLDNPEEIPAVPKHIATWESFEDPLREEYPIQCIGHHTKRRSHSTHDNNPWLEEVEPQRLWINQIDAAERGIENEDLVEVFNDRGRVRVKAFVTNKIMPGVASLPQGGWYTPDEDGVDTRGSINVLTKQQPTALAKANPQHTNLVEIKLV